MPTLYTFSGSPASSVVLMVAKAIGLSLDEKIVDISTGEQFKPEYIKLNPQHTVPTLVDDDGFSIWDSQAIIIYLVSKYAKDDSLYPNDLKKRAVIHQRLHYQSGVLFPTMGDIAHPLIKKEQTDVAPKEKERVANIYDLLEVLLEGREWIAGDSPTIADYSFLPLVSFFNSFIPADEQDFPRLTGWLKRVAALPGAEANEESLQKLVDICS